MREYALVPENQITAAVAAKFPVMTNFPSTYVFSSTIVTDASGQESEIYDDYTLARWVESGEDGFTADQANEISKARANFNKGRGGKPQFPETRGNEAHARDFNMGNKIDPGTGV